jgi:hypothetical protein
MYPGKGKRKGDRRAQFHVWLNLERSCAMLDQADTSERPKRLLLASDLSARTDRALDRALLLAAEWQAELEDDGRVGASRASLAR